MHRREIVKARSGVEAGPFPDILHFDLGAIGIGTDDDFFKLFRVLEQSHRAHIELAFLAGRSRLRTDAARRRLRVLLFERVLYVRGSDAQRGQPVRFEPEAHGVILGGEVFDVAHASHALDRVHQVDIAVVSKEDRVIRLFGR